MACVRFQNSKFEIQPGQTVLDCLTEHGVRISSSCKTGICQTCMLRSTSGTVPVSAQQGLRSTLVDQGYFLSCVCIPADTIAVEMPGTQANPVTHVSLVAKDWLNEDTARLMFEGDFPDEAKSGQFFNIERPSDGLIRSYSSAQIGMGSLEIHVRRLPGGKMSSWLCDEISPGVPCRITGPYGACYYAGCDADQPILMIGTGTGLAPLLGIANDALAKGHRGTIRLYHGSYRTSGLYLVSELKLLAKQYSNFEYLPCVDFGEHGTDKGEFRIKRADLAAAEDLADLTGYRVFLCGHPEMVKSAKRRSYLAGASLKDIFADPFVISPVG